MKLVTIIKLFSVLIICIGLAVYKISAAHGIESYYSMQGKPYFSTIDVGSFSPGIIENIYYYEGDEVRTGDVIIKLSNPVIEERFKSIEKNPVDVTSGIYAEFEEKIKNFEIKAPADGYIYKINKAEKSFIKESDILIVIIPKSTFRYSFEVTAGHKRSLPFELRSYFKKDQEVVVRLNDTESFNGKISSIIADKDINDETSFVEKYIITSDKQFDSINRLSDNINILFPKTTMAVRTSGILQNITQRLNLNYKF